MKIKVPLLLFLFLFLVCNPFKGYAQESVENYMPYDPSNTQSRVPLDLDSYYFLGQHQFYAFRLAYNYGIADRHMMGISVPVIHAIFNGDFAGFENTTGVGDIRFTYMGVPFQAKKNALGIKRVASFLEVTVPIGNERLGRGVGAWVYRPGIIVTYQPDINWYIFPEVNFQFSTNEINSRGGSYGTPDLENPEKDDPLDVISVNLPTTYTLQDWNGWVGLSGDYSFSLSEETYFLFLRMEVGKMISPKTSASLHLTRFVAGQPRLQTIFRARILFFLN